jgi:ABC-type branched-subunit amino acid transport system ATPase component
VSPERAKPRAPTTDAGVLSSVTPAHLVRMRAIAKRFGSIEALREVDLRLAAGEVLGLVGDNAAGKSTLTKILAGALEADSATIEVDGEVVHFTSPAEARARRIDMVYQDLSLCDTVAERGVGETSLEDLVQLIVGQRVAAEQAAGHA